MHLRFVRMKIKEARAWDAKEFYVQSVIPQLEQTDGCLFAGFLQGTIHGDEYISMTVWASVEAAEEYVKGGLFDRLLDESDELLQETEEWATDLPHAADQVVFSGAEPEVESWDIAGDANHDVLLRVGDGRVFVRMVAIRLRPGAFGEFERRFASKVRPVLAETPGCLGALLVAGVRNTNRALSVTLWEREEDAIRYGLSGEFERLTLHLKDTFSDLYQWNIVHSGGDLPGESPMTRSLDVEGFHMVVGRSLT